MCASSTNIFSLSSASPVPDALLHRVLCESVRVIPPALPGFPHLADMEAYHAKGPASELLDKGKGEWSFRVSVVALSCATPKLLEQHPIANTITAGVSLKTPGSKSISNRALLLAALSSGTTKLRNLLHSDDTRVMRAALGEMGVCRPIVLLCTPLKYDCARLGCHLYLGRWRRDACGAWTWWELACARCW